MQTIYKYRLTLAPKSAVQLPKGAKILSLQYSRTNDEICMWAQVDDSRPYTKRTIECVKTGVELEKGKRRFIGTLRFGELTAHFFERI